MTVAPPAAKADHEAREIGLGGRVLLTGVTWLLRAWAATLRWQMDDRTRSILHGEGPPGVVVLWHNRLFLTPVLYRRFRLGRRPMAAIISASRDGGWFSELVRRFQMVPVRGSSSRRSLTAVREAQRLLDAGYDIAITPDGPRGPCYDFKVGVVFLARLSKCPVTLINAEFTRATRLRSWDRAYLPWPGSRVIFRAEQIDDLAARTWESNEAAAAWLRARLLALAPPDDS